MKISIATILQHISENFLIHSLQCDKLLIASNFQLKHMVFRQSIQNSVICSFFAISESDTLFLKLLSWRNNPLLSMINCVQVQMGKTKQLSYSIQHEIFCVHDGVCWDSASPRAT